MRGLGNGFDKLLNIYLEAQFSGVARQNGARGENLSAAPVSSQLSHFLPVDLFLVNHTFLW